MTLLRFIPELPLLRRELIELANRRRTYIVRFLGAIAILTWVVIEFYMAAAMIGRGQMQPGTWNPNRYRGSGGVIFNEIVPRLFLLVEFLMPALICGSITLEKERNTLGTLFVTRLTPLTIVLEKLGSRLIPMFTLLLLTFPILAFVYTLGGVDTTYLVATLWLLFCECLFFAALGLMCSSWFSTTISAFIASYVLTGLCLILANVWPKLTPFGVWQMCFVAQTWRGPGGGLLLDWLSEGLLGAMVAILRYSLTSLGLTCVFVMLARVFLIRRAFVTPSSHLLRLFRRIDVMFTRLNDRTTGGVVIVKDRNPLPAFDPVAWRERAKKSLGKARYLFRILVVLEGPVMFICLGAATSGSGVDSLRGLLYLMWGITTIILAVKSSTMISSERARETLDALLSTPLTAREIITQKVQGTQRLMMVLAIPLLSIHLTILLMHFDITSIFRAILQLSGIAMIGTFFLYAVLTTFGTFVLMHLISWMAALPGLRSATQPRSVMSSLTVLTGIIMIPIILFHPQSLLTTTLMEISGNALDVPRDMLFRQGGEIVDATVKEKRNLAQLLVAGLCYACRPDGLLQANETLLQSYYGLTSRSGWRETVIQRYTSETPALGGSILVALSTLLVHASIMHLVKGLTLKLAPRLLSRRDQVPSAPMAEPVPREVTIMAAETGI